MRCASDAGRAEPGPSRHRTRDREMTLRLGDDGARLNPGTAVEFPTSRTRKANRAKLSHIPAPESTAGSSMSGIVEVRISGAPLSPKPK